MRTFDDEDGRTWSTSVQERTDSDYKGRYHFHMALQDEEDEGISLHDVRWNSERTAMRTLATMSLVELRRRLRQAQRRKGHAESPTA